MVGEGGRVDNERSQRQTWTHSLVVYVSIVRWVTKALWTTRMVLHLHGMVKGKGTPPQRFTAAVKSGMGPRLLEPIMKGCWPLVGKTDRGAPDR